MAARGIWRIAVEISELEKVWVQVARWTELRMEIPCQDCVWMCVYVSEAKNTNIYKEKNISPWSPDFSVLICMTDVWIALFSVCF